MNADERDVEFALHWDEVGEREIARTLIQAYFSRLKTIAYIFTGSEDAARKLVIASTRRAIQNRAKFQGQTSARAWLYRDLLGMLKIWIRRFGPGSVHIGHPSFDALAAGDQLLAWCMLVEQFDEAELAFALEEPVRKIRRRSEQIRQQIFPDASNQSAGPAWRFDPGEPAAGWDTAEKETALQELVDLRPKRHILAGLYFKVRRPKSAPQRTGRPGELALISTGLMLFLFLIWYLNQVTDVEGVPIFPTPTGPVPTALEPPAGTLSIPSEADALAYAKLSLDPVLSEDGRWVVFTSNNSRLVEVDTNDRYDVFLYDRIADRHEIISRTGDGLQANGDSHSADLSADGRWVVFASDATNLWGSSLGDGSKSASYFGLTHIYLHDRVSGETSLVSTSMDGRPANASSFHPRISGDGRWILFWSADPALGGSGDSACPEMVGQECLDLMVFDRVSAELRRIPIGKSEPGLPPGPGRSQADISGDGRWIVATVPGSAAIFEQNPELRQLIGPQGEWPNLIAIEAGTGIYHPVNAASDGTPGDGMAAYPSISADGRFVAFVSRSTNLVDDDTNERADVFVRDLREGRTERVSIDEDGQQGNEDSGVLFGGQGEEPGQVSISADGRWVTFPSRASNLLSDQHAAWCAPAPDSFWTCHGLFVHDRAAAHTRSLNIRPFNGLFLGENILMYPSISADGNWLAFLGFVWSQTADCDTGDCAEVYLHAIESQNTRHVSSSRFAALDQAQWGFDRVMNEAHLDGIEAVAYSPDGSMIASGGRDAQVKLWRVEDGSLIYAWPVNARIVSSLAFSPDGALLAAGDFDGLVHVFRLSDGQRLYVLDEHPGLVQSLAFSPDGSTLAVGALRTVWLWDREEDGFYLARELKLSGSFVGGLDFSPGGRLLAAAPSTSTTWIFSPSSGEVLLRLRGHERKVLAVQFSPEGSLLATGGQDRFANVWSLTWNDSQLQADHQLMLLHRDWVSALDFAPDGRLLAAGSFDSAVYMWRLPDGLPLQILRRSRQDQVLSVDFAPDGRSLASATVRGLIRFWADEKLLLAQRGITRYFERAEADEIDASQAISGTGNLVWPEIGSLEQAAEMVAFRLRVPVLPDRNFVAEHFYAPVPFDGRAIAIVFRDREKSSCAFRFTQSMWAPDHELQNLIGLSAQVETLPMAGTRLEFVSGNWVLESHWEDKVALMRIFRYAWDRDIPLWRLRWQEGTDYFEIGVEQPETGACLSRDDLIEMVSSLP